MYYVPDGTEMCGYYECKECGNRFLALQTGPQLVCPYCGEEPDMEPLCGKIDAIRSLLD